MTLGNRCPGKKQEHVRRKFPDFEKHKLKRDSLDSVPSALLLLSVFSWDRGGLALGVL
jgi:hypothetical protein